MKLLWESSRVVFVPFEHFVDSKDAQIDDKQAFQASGDAESILFP